MLGYVVVVDHCYRASISWLELKCLFPNLLGLGAFLYPLLFSSNASLLKAPLLWLHLIIANSVNIWYLTGLLKSWTLCPDDSWSMCLCIVLGRIEPLAEWTLVAWGITRLPEWQCKDGIRCSLCLSYDLVDKNFSSSMAERACIVWVSGVRKGGRVVNIAGDVWVNTTSPVLLLWNFSNLKN